MDDSIHPRGAGVEGNPSAAASVTRPKQALPAHPAQTDAQPSRPKHIPAFIAGTVQLVLDRRPIPQVS